MAVTISDRQLKIHKATELLSVLFVAPFSAYLATRKQLPDWARVASAALALSIIYVDGGLVLTWMAKKKGQTGPFGVW